MFTLLCEKKPEHPAGYNILCIVLRDRGSPSDAIESLRGPFHPMPNERMLWNTLATTLAEEGRAEESLVFYQEALRLDPKFARVWHNLGYAYAHLGRLEEALEAYDNALAFAPDAHEKLETRHSSSICLIDLGKL